MNMQELETFLENLNRVGPQSQDEELQRVAREYASLNESLFQCLESHRYSNLNKVRGLVHNYCVAAKVFGGISCK